jgi:cell division protein FtsI/penicillin-binding protein 2
MPDSDATKRVRLLARLALLWALIIVGRLVQLQVVSHKQYVDLAQEQQERALDVRAPRGTIYDRNGQILAESLPVDSVCVDPLLIPDISLASQFLGVALDLDPATLYDQLESAVARKRGFLWVKRRITPEESRRLRSFNVDWVEFRTESHRFYPNNDLAAHVVGSVDHGENGNSGLELSMNQELEGHDGEIRVLTDVKRHAYATQVDEKAVPGMDITTTIDSRIQYVAEQALKDAVETSHAVRGSVVAMNPYTGEVLALANFPTFNPNDPPKPGESLADRNDVAITSPYEPGSVFKVVTLSAALETTSLRPDSLINCHNGVLRLGSRVIHEAETHGFGVLSMADVLARSSNIGAIEIGMHVGPQNMYNYMRRLGFGSPTGIELPSESAGLVRRMDRWGKTSLASMSMGHEVAVTAIQLAQLGCIIANGGVMVHPHVILREQRAGERPRPEILRAPVRVLRPATAITMRRMMEGVVTLPYGTAYRYARLAGYTSAGKTGTAQIYDFAAHEYSHHYNGSFVGMAPVTNPAIVIAVTLNGTSGGAGFGGPVAAPVFHQVAAAAMRLMDVPKDLPDQDEASLKKSSPVEITDDLSIAGLDPSFGPELVSSDPQALASAPQARDQRLFLPVSADRSKQAIGPRVPDFQGKTVRDVVEESERTGIPVDLLGHGVARAQAPAPGEVLLPGERVRVEFGR